MALSCKGFQPFVRKSPPRVARHHRLQHVGHTHARRVIVAELISDSAANKNLFAGGVNRKAAARDYVAHHGAAARDYVAHHGAAARDHVAHRGAAARDHAAALPNDTTHRKAAAHQ